jgi:rod shape-determining protein MreD
MARSHRSPGIRPNRTIGRQLDIAWRHAFPVTTSLLLMMLSLTHSRLWGQGALLPTVALTCVWFWSLYRPSAMAPPVVFLIGLLLDLIALLPLGVGAVTMLATYGIARRLRGFLASQGFAMVWLIFTSVACVIAALNWALVSLLTVSFMPTGPVLFQAGVAAAMYPVVAIPLTLAHRSIADPDLA